MKSRQHTEMDHSSGNEERHSAYSMYWRFALMAVVMFVAMYFIMFAMIDGFENLIPNLNNLYMTLLMVSVMMLIELWMMRRMYTHPKINRIIGVIAVILGVFSWLGIREQINIGDRQFVKGMIPHHAAALLMSEKAKLNDPDLIRLKKNILETQADEIELMKRKLKEFEKYKQDKN
ncbi:DUF305 domain-containing protein [Chryseobacterium arthrosphaerae]|uniref:DUF305 domain-containing protein n=2 Tax=Chryseobacterium arthrosphaerae TaxID=651561 RepID=A0A1B8ZSI0_9FLAO|nr:DUF305 domain-containing protein [Chryseobacterium arthrosphaerae]